MKKKLQASIFLTTQNGAADFILGYRAKTKTTKDLEKKKLKARARLEAKREKCLQGQRPSNEANLKKITSNLLVIGHFCLLNNKRKLVTRPGYLQFVSVTSHKARKPRESVSIRAR